MRSILDLVPSTRDALGGRILRLDRALAFLDLETTGTDPRIDRIVEIAVLKLLPGGSELTFQSLVDPEMPIPASATAVHHISDADVAGKPDFRALALTIADFVRDCDLAGFNITRFDLPLLEGEFRRVSLPFSFAGANLVDVQTIFLAREKRTLSAAVRFYCDAHHAGAHSALEDALAARQVLMAQLRRYHDLPDDVESLSAFCREARPATKRSAPWFLETGADLLFARGQRHRGETLSQVAKSDPGYLACLLDLELSDDVKDQVRRTLQAAGAAR